MRALKRLGKGPGPDDRQRQRRIQQCEEWAWRGQALQNVEQLAAEGKKDEARMAVLVLERQGGLKRPSNWTVALSALSRVGDYKGAMWLADRMPEPTTFAYNAVLQACRVGKASDAAESVLATMRDRGVEPDAVSYATMAGARTSWDSEARKLVDLARKKAVDERGQATALRQGMRLCQDADEALKFLSDMPDPGPADFKECVEVCGLAGRPAEARRVLEQAMERGSDDDATWARYIAACGKNRRINTALEAYETLRARRTPGAKVAAAVLKLLAFERDKRAAQFLRQVEARDLPLNIECYTWAIRALRDDWKLCLELLARARRDGHPVTGTACAAALEALAMAGEQGLAAELLDEMKRRGIPLADHGAVAWLRCLIKAGRPHAALDAYYSTHNRPLCLKPALEACVAIPDSRSAVDLLPTDAPTSLLAICVAACAADGNWRDALSLVTSRRADRRAFDDAIAACVAPDVDDDRLLAAAECWDAAQLAGIFPSPRLGKRDKVLNLDVHGLSLHAAFAGTFAAIRKAYHLRPQLPPTLTLLTGAAKLKPALQEKLKATLGIASKPNEANPGVLVVPAASIQAWGDKHPHLQISLSSDDHPVAASSSETIPPRATTVVL